MNKKSIIIFGFPGVGKSYAYDHQEELQATIQDSDSSHFHWLYQGEGFDNPVLDEDGKKVVHPAWPANYAEYISLTGREQKDVPDFILVSTHKEVMEAILALEFPETWILVPARDDKEKYLELYKQRGSSPEFIQNMDKNWDAFIDSVHSCWAKCCDAEYCSNNLFILTDKIKNVSDFIAHYPTR